MHPSSCLSAFFNEARNKADGGDGNQSVKDDGNQSVKDSELEVLLGRTAD